MSEIINILSKNSGMILEMGLSFLKLSMILIIGWIIAKAIARVVEKVLITIKIDVLADKLHEIDIIEKSNFKIVPSKIISMVLYYMILLITISAAADSMQMNVVSDLVARLIAYMPKLLIALVILAIGLWVSNSIREVVHGAFKALGIPGSGVISGFIFYFLLINITLMAMAQAEINTEFLTGNISLILGGIVLSFAIGYGFASRDIMSNLLGGLYSKNKIEVGDEIRIGDIRGIVIARDSNSLTIQKANSTCIVPLGRLVTEEMEKF